MYLPNKVLKALCNIQTSRNIGYIAVKNLVYLIYFTPSRAVSESITLTVTYYLRRFKDSVSV